MYPYPPYGYPPPYPPPLPPEKEDNSSGVLAILGAIFIVLLLGISGKYAFQYFINTVEVKTIVADSTRVAKTDTVTTKYTQEFPLKGKVRKVENTEKTVVTMQATPVKVVVPTTTPIKSISAPAVLLAKVTPKVVAKRLNYKPVTVKCIYIYSTGVFTKGSTIGQYALYLGKPDTKVMYHYLVNNAEILNTYPVNLQAAHGSAWANTNGLSIAISPNTMSTEQMQAAIVNAAKLSADLCKKYKLDSTQIRQGGNVGVLNNPAKWTAFLSLVDVYLK